jgi:hypothetical protein
MSFAEELNLKRAIKRVKNDILDDAMSDVVRYRDFFGEEESILEMISSKLEDVRRYRAEEGYFIDIPKSGFTLRPASLPRFVDRIIYQALADNFLEVYIPESCVYSNLPDTNDSSYMFQRGVKLWVQMNQKIRKEAEKYPYVIRTDLASYFDHTYHKLFKSRINDLFGKKFSKSYLDNANILLGKLWNKLGNHQLRNFGIPQINDPSSFFGNIYLDEIDKWLVSLPGPAFRYVDDFYIFTKTEAEAKKYLSELITRLRTMGLYISSAKTFIKSSEYLINDISDRERKIDSIDTMLYSKNINKIQEASDLVVDLFMSEINNDSDFDDRLFRFCINRLKKLQATDLGGDIHETAIKEVLQRLITKPNETSTFVDYLSMFPDDERIQKKICEFLISEDNIYNWQEMHLLEYLIRSNLVSALDSEFIRYLRKVIEQNNPWSSSKAMVFWGKNGSYAHRREIRELFSDDNHLIINRGLFIAIQEMNKSERDHFYDTSCNDDFETSYLVNFIKKMDNPTYHYFNPPTGYDIFFEEDYDSDDLRDDMDYYFI